jgi:hypothetical protein
MFIYEEQLCITNMDFEILCWPGTKINSVATWHSPDPDLLFPPGRFYYLTPSTVRHQSPPTSQEFHI